MLIVCFKGAELCIETASGYRLLVNPSDATLKADAFFTPAQGFVTGAEGAIQNNLYLPEHGLKAEALVRQKASCAQPWAGFTLWAEDLSLRYLADDQGRCPDHCDILCLPFQEENSAQTASVVCYTGGERGQSGKECAVTSTLHTSVLRITRGDLSEQPRRVVLCPLEDQT